MDPVSLLLIVNPEIRDVPKIDEFLKKRYHIIFEKADLENNLCWFKLAKEKGWLPSMIAYRKITNNFSWKNFDKWIEVTK
jgi:hypothetical protein